MTTPTAPDQVVRLLATDGYDVHRLIYEAFVTGGGRDFLYAPFAVGGGLHAVFVRRFDVQTRFAAGMQFAMTLRAMPAVKANGRWRSIGAARAKDGLRLRWLEARARERGFTLAGDPRDARRARCGSRAQASWRSSPPCGSFRSSATSCRTQPLARTDGTCHRSDCLS